jgi:hypothetical protein
MAVVGCQTELKFHTKDHSVFTGDRHQQYSPMRVNVNSRIITSRKRSLRATEERDGSRLGSSTAFMKHGSHRWKGAAWTVKVYVSKLETACKGRTTSLVDRPSKADQLVMDAQRALV